MLEKPLGGRGILLGGVPGVAAGEGDGHRRRRGRHERGVHRDRHGGRGLRLRPQHRPPARARPRLRRPRARPCYASTLEIEQRLPRDRPRDRRGARARRQGAARDPPRAAQADEAQRRARRRLDRPGRLLRDLAPDDALRPDLRGRRDHPLLRGEHARRGADHLDLRAHQRDAALRAPPRRRGRRPARARENPGCAGVNVVGGKVTYEPVAEATGQPYTPLFEALGEAARA